MTSPVRKPISVRALTAAFSLLSKLQLRSVIYFFNIYLTQNVSENFLQSMRSRLRNAAIEYADASEAMAAHGIDPQHVRRFYPPALQYPPTNLLRDLISRRDLPTARILNTIASLGQICIRSL